MSSHNNLSAACSPYRYATRKIATEELKCGYCMQMSGISGGCHYNVLRRPASKSPTPTMAAATPATKSQMVRSLGAPVKSSDKREPTEAEACIPKMISTTPTTSKAIPMMLCMPLSSCVLYQYFAKKLADFSGLYPRRS